MQTNGLDIGPGVHPTSNSVGWQTESTAFLSMEEDAIQLLHWGMVGLWVQALQKQNLAGRVVLTLHRSLFPGSSSPIGEVNFVIKGSAGGANSLELARYTLLTWSVRPESEMPVWGCIWGRDGGTGKRRLLTVGSWCWYCKGWGSQGVCWHHWWISTLFRDEHMCSRGNFNVLFCWGLSNWAFAMHWQ